MREILFRGKRLDNGEWVEGCLLGADVREDRPPAIVYCDYKRLYCEDEVDPATVGEYTGLCDKNGAAIFEGDIIRVIYEADSSPECVAETWAELYQVVFSDHYHAWFTQLNDGDIGEWLYEYDGDCEIVGNIHDNTVIQL